MDYMNFYAQRLRQTQYGAEEKLTFVEQAKRFFLPEYRKEQESLAKKNKFKRYAMWGGGTLVIGALGVFIYRKRKSGGEEVQAQLLTEEIAPLPEASMEEQIEVQVDTGPGPQPPSQGLEDLLSQLKQEPAVQEQVEIDEETGIKTGSENVPFQDLSGGKSFNFGDLGMAAIAIQE